MIAIAQVDELLLLAGPESANAFAVQLDDAEAQEPLVEHYDLVVVRVVVDDVAQREQRRHAGQDGPPPRGVPLVRDDELLLVVRDGLVEDARVVVLVGAREVVLVEFERHAHARRHHPPQELHVVEHPLVAQRGDAEVAFEQGVQSVEEELDAGQGRVRRRAERPPAEQTEGQAKRHEKRVAAALDGFLAPPGAVLHPVQVNGAKAGPSDARHVIVVVLVDVDVEDGVQIGVGSVRRKGLQGFANRGVRQPIFEAWRSRYIINHALHVVSNKNATEVEHVQHARRIVIGDAVAFQHVFGGHNLYRQHFDTVKTRR